MANTHAIPTRTFFLLIALGSSLWAMNGAEAAQRFSSGCRQSTP